MSDSNKDDESAKEANKRKQFMERLGVFVNQFLLANDIEKSELADKSKDELKELIEVMAQTFKIDINYFRDVSAADVLYLLDHYPFLIIKDRGETAVPYEQVQIVEAVSGWDVRDKNDEMQSSPGRYIFGGGYFSLGEDGEEEDEGGGGVNLGKGTIHKQAFDTAADMLRMAKEKGWESVTIVDGHPYMMRAAWLASTVTQGLAIAGFQPTQADKQLRERFMMSGEELATRWEEIKRHAALESPGSDKKSDPSHQRSSGLD